MKKNGVIFLENIKKTFDDELILDWISFAVKDGEFMTLLGPSGCGKTTTLRIIGGFETPDSGNVYFDGKVINTLPPYKRNVNTVFQKYALFPHMDVYDNIAFGLKIKKMSPKEIDLKVSEMLELVNLKGYDSRAITQLSGGQQQRVAIARALVNKPRVLLLDEPLGALDLKLRKEMQVELKNIQQQLGITFIYVTHDQEEALTMSDTIVVMDKGVILQNDTPVNIYNEPKNAFVAEFIGESNILDGVMLDDYKAEFAGSVFTCVDKGFLKNEPVDVVIRPEDIRFTSEENSLMTGVVENVIFKGVHYEILVSSNREEDKIDYDWMIHSTSFEPVGKRVGMFLTPADIHIMKKSEYSKKGAPLDDEEL